MGQSITSDVANSQGWQGEHTVRQRRAVAKQVTILSNAGVLDVLAVGESHTRCLRLKKHDPDYLPPVQSAEEDAPTAEATLETLDDDAIRESVIEKRNER